jgi:hypothetical protein
VPPKKQCLSLERFPFDTYLFYFLSCDLSLSLSPGVCMRCIQLFIAHKASIFHNKLANQPFL